MLHPFLGIFSGQVYGFIFNMTFLKWRGLFSRMTSQIIPFIDCLSCFRMWYSLNISGRKEGTAWIMYRSNILAFLWYPLQVNSEGILTASLAGFLSTKGLFQKQKTSRVIVEEVQLFASVFKAQQTGLLPMKFITVFSSSTFWLLIVDFGSFQGDNSGSRFIRNLTRALISPFLIDNKSGALISFNCVKPYDFALHHIILKYDHILPSLRANKGTFEWVLGVHTHELRI